jgi:hypothetical protein
MRSNLIFFFETNKVDSGDEKSHFLSLTSNDAILTKKKSVFFPESYSTSSYVPTPLRIAKQAQPEAAWFCLSCRSCIWQWR